MSDSGAVRQWGRVAEVIIGKGGSGLKVTNLRIQFEIVKTVDHTPNKALIKIFNLNPENEAKIKKEYTNIFLNAGYKDNIKLVFTGNIIHVFRYREGNDFITEIEAADGDNDYRNAFVNTVLASGTTNADVVDQVAKTFTSTSNNGVKQVTGAARTRGKVLVGNSRDALHKVANQSGANWSIQDGVLQIVKTDLLLPNEAIVVNALTGMLSSPEINEEGITVKFLMNPNARANGSLKLDNNSIKLKGQKVGETQKGNQLTGTTVDSSNMPATDKTTKLDTDGIYKILKLTHKGDTRSQTWQTEALCVALGGRSTVSKGKKK